MLPANTYSVASEMPAKLESRKCQMRRTDTNMVQGNYRPFFFDLEKYHLSRVNFSTVFFNSGETERELLHGSRSFFYLREDKMRVIDAYEGNNSRISFDEFLNYLGISIRSKNIFKSGKYLSRIFRPVRYGSFYRELDIYVNTNPSLIGKKTDGLSLISLELAHSLGWKKARAGNSGQFTLFYDGGLVKGNCIISDTIGHDVIIYGNENIKDEISLHNGFCYVSLEPQKLSPRLRLDIQSMLNLWNLIGPEQYLQWVYDGIEQFKDDLFSGKLSEWLDSFSDIEVEDYEKEKWTLRKAIWHKVDYTRFPGLIRSGWTLFKNSILRFAEDKEGSPVFRIHVPGGMRGYLRVDLRQHDSDGNFSPVVEVGEIEVDELGNIWIHPDDITGILETLGGGDLDDSAGIIPLEGNNALFYRNPNQYGEFIISGVMYTGVKVDKVNKQIGIIPVRKAVKRTVNSTNLIDASDNDNRLLSTFLKKLPPLSPKYIEYSLTNLLKTYSKISQNSANIGIAANIEMIKATVGIDSPEIFRFIDENYTWSLENVIDATVKDGVDAKGDMEAAYGLLNYVYDNAVELPETIFHRFPSKMRDDLIKAKNHKLDELLNAIKYLIKKADLEILGKGTVSRGNRIPGVIDNLNVPLIELGYSVLNSLIHDLAFSLMQSYNRSMAILLENTNDLPVTEAEAKRKAGIEQIQLNLLREMSYYTRDERSEITKVWMYEIYKSSKAVHDSILWIGDKEDYQGTSDDTIQMLANSGIGYQIKYSEGITRILETKKDFTFISQVRLWHNAELKAEMFTGVAELLIQNGKAILGSDILNIGDECDAKDGIYSVKKVVQAISKKDNRMLKNSLTVYINC